MKKNERFVALGMRADAEDLLAQVGDPDEDAKAAFAVIKRRLMGEVRARLQAQRELQGSVAEAAKYPPFSRLCRWRERLVEIAPRLLDASLGKAVTKLTTILPNQPADLPSLDKLQAFVPVMDKGGIRLELLVHLFEGSGPPAGVSPRRLGAYSIFSDRVDRTDVGRLPTPAERVVAEIRQLLEEDYPQLLRQDN